ncbi:hypothetical protein BDAP_001072 [Binucleata daphniae]
MHCKSYFVLFIQTILSRQITDKATEIANEIREVRGDVNKNEITSDYYLKAAGNANSYVRGDKICNILRSDIIKEYNRIMKIEFDGLNSDEIIFKCKIPQDLQQQEIKERIEAKYKELVEGRQDLDDSKKEILDMNIFIHY